jgi:hypothetical protein
MHFPIEKIGIVHHMLYPNYVVDQKYHADTVIALSQREDIGCFDCCLPVDASERKRAIEGIRGCGKQITYVNHLFPMKKFSMGSADFAERQIIRDFLLREVDTAAAVGASQFLFVSGADMPGDRDDAIKRFGEMAVWLCERLGEHGITGIIEPIDTCVDKRFLLGSTKDSVAFVESLRPAVKNLALVVDMGHIPLLFENYEDAYRCAGAVLERVHLSNCLVGDTNDMFFGDRHPSFFYPGGYVDENSLPRVLRVLKEIGYLDSPHSLVFEVNPLPGEAPDDTVKNHLAILNKAMEMVEATAD